MLFIVSLFLAKISYSQVDTSTIVDYNHAKVLRVINGDTFELENGERVRLLGIDTPEKWDSNKLKTDAGDRAGKKNKEDYFDRY